jgi:putative ABC transport system ATP-binding protein
MAPNATVDARGLHKIYREGPVMVHAVRGVDLRVMAGSFVLLMGPSGSGKSSVLSMLGCLLRPTRGELRLLGEKVVWDERRLPHIRRGRIGFIFQHFNLLSSLTAAENVAVTLRLRRDHRNAEARARRLLEALGVGERWNFSPKDMSGGERQRVAIARALIGNPPILLADEPTGDLDSASGRSVAELLKRSAVQENRTVIVVSHDTRIVEFADEVITLEDGRVTTHEVASSHEALVQMRRGHESIRV